MRGRKEEIHGINGRMRQVNETYKSLTHVLGSPQEQIDHVETQMDESKENAENELAHVVKANEKV
jgi:t-SNARE complex subunit (syntaxin)